ncbi:MAG: TlpA family protein disulfide reductase [Rudaea sp.]
MRRNRLWLIAGVLLIVVCLGWAALAGLLLLRGPLSPVNAGAALPAAPDAAQAITPQPGAPSVGSVAPDFTLPAIDNRKVSLAQFRGKPVIVNFWATWCGPCNAEMPNLEKVYQQHKNDIVILAIDQGDSGDQVKGFSEIYHLNFPLILDQKMQVGDRYRVNALPTTVFVDKQGIVREIHIGGPMTTDFIESRIRTLLGH